MPSVLHPADKVYFVGDNADGPVKIGTTQMPIDKRLHALQMGNPQKLSVLAVCAGGRALERETHNLFKDLHIRGEWYARSPKLIAYAEVLAAKQPHSGEGRKRYKGVRTGRIDRRSALLRKIEVFQEETGMPDANIGSKAINDPGFVWQLKAGRNPSADTVERVERWLAA